MRKITPAQTAVFVLSFTAILLLAAGTTYLLVPGLLPAPFTV
ncbi:MAG: hypothetical protein U5K56_05815 [Halioglobus sp.]|nr:hypothetical protein [Halioglobus sp.]